MHDFKKLSVWNISMEMCSEIFKVTRSFPRDEKFGLTSQIMRCAVSIPSNISEGCGRRTERDFNHFLNISLGSSFELETQLILAKRFEYIDDTTLARLQEQNSKVQRMINGLQQKLNLRQTGK